jgi:hypothetical protein
MRPSLSAPSAPDIPVLEIYSSGPKALYCGTMKMARGVHAAMQRKACLPLARRFHHSSNLLFIL